MKLKPLPRCAIPLACRLPPAQLDIKQDIQAKMRIVAEAACAEGETIHNMHGGATPDRCMPPCLWLTSTVNVTCKSGNNLQIENPRKCGDFFIYHAGPAQATSGIVCYSRSKRSGSSLSPMRPRNLSRTSRGHRCRHKLQPLRAVQS